MQDVFEAERVLSKLEAEGGETRHACFMILSGPLFHAVEKPARSFRTTVVFDETDRSLDVGDFPRLHILCSRTIVRRSICCEPVMAKGNPLSEEMCVGESSSFLR